VIAANGSRESEMQHPRTTIFVLAAAMSTGARAKGGHDDDSEESFYEARLFSGLNDTDRNLSIHGRYHAVNAPGETGDEPAMKSLKQTHYGANNNLRANARGILKQN
jgi:hypothetical protein